MEEPKRVALYWPRGFFFWQRRCIYAKGFLLEEKRHGKWVFWYLNGKRQLEGEFLADKKNGTWLKWHENGTKTTEGTFIKGKMHGKWTDWHSNGQKALVSHWVMGKRDGNWAYWDVHGALEKTVSYDHNSEDDKRYSIHTDWETKQLVRRIQRRNTQIIWERLVGKFVAKIVKPWHVACWTLFFIPIFSFLESQKPWRSIAFASLLAFLITSLLVWFFEQRRPK